MYAVSVVNVERVVQFNELIYWHAQQHYLGHQCQEQWKYNNILNMLKNDLKLVEENNFA